MTKIQKISVLVTVLLCCTYITSSVPDHRPFKHILHKCRVEAVLNRTLSEDAKNIHTFNRYSVLLCLNIKLGIMKSTGDINKQTLKKMLLEMGTTEPKTRLIIAECGKCSGDDMYETALELINCVHYQILTHKSFQKAINSVLT
ncbi:unnamed protein product [Psylliodes chrysocephalus]|uniref:Uncharacterized protein n=1 Tax=Psylliodes chrysocephalus TaxID=3402493 RepID=A0A9P0GE23_9CUCU|nr:unnamed protein product [Psylliodes chrysocephala]